MPYNTLIHTKELQMTEQELIELWGDGTQFGMNTEMVGALNNAFREVAVKFALVVADKAYAQGWKECKECWVENGFLI